MNQRQRTNESVPQNIIPGEPGGDDLADVQQKMNDLLSAGDAAIAATLSGDSEKYLSSAHQPGGQ
jgi:hypothetical protein